MIRFIPFFLFACLRPHPAFAESMWMVPAIATLSYVPGLLLALCILRGPMRGRLVSVAMAGVIGLLLSVPLFLVATSFYAAALSNVIIMGAAILIDRRRDHDVPGGFSIFEMVWKIAAVFGVLFLCTLVTLPILDRMKDEKRYNAAVALANQGDARGQLELGRIYYEQYKDEEALVWLRKAADAGLTDAQLELAGAYELNGAEKGQGLREAGELYKKLADKGEVRAALKLGDLYRNGGPVAYRGDRRYPKEGGEWKKDTAQAIKWYAKAAAETKIPGDSAPHPQIGSKALENIAEIYLNGEGVPQDRAKAYVYYLRAEKRALWRSYRFSAEGLWSSLTDDERAEAQRQMGNTK